ncbi:MAG: DUF4405 domain-containing protein [Spirochaetales bacterium]|nr:DUF4405 domain-containing protein [Spirochaetales bacterium]
MSDNKKGFSLRCFVSVMTLCTFLITGVSGLVLLLSDGHGSSGGVMINWNEMHEIACIFFAIFGVWHLILNLKVLCAYFKDKDRQFSFRLDWLIPVVIALVFLVTISFIPAERHEYRGYNPEDFYKRSKGHGH